MDIKGRLNPNKIDYIFYHLSFFIELTDDLKNQFVFADENINQDSNYILFPLSSEDLNFENIPVIDQIPVLFPCGKEKMFYTLENNNLIFHHDLLKSSFYLLSGIQEYKSAEKDFLGRFPFSESIQNKLGIISKPIVNYYFEIIIQGIEAFCKLNNIQLRKKVLFSDAGLLLTHDIDKIDAYNFPDFVFKVKQLLGLTKKKYAYNRIVKSNLKYIYRFLNPFYKKNPFWNFEFLTELDNKLGFKSSFYFLHKDQKVDSYYTFNEPRIKKLISQLITHGHEVGIHGTVKSSINLQQMQENIRLLEEVSPESVVGGRQHRLMFEMPLTLKIHEQCGLAYDSTLGFAAHEGFRNSYCLPFKLYDFENDQMIDVWEIPLVAMDGTLFSYRRLNSDDAFNSVKILLEEVQKFNGIFTLLWHNNFFDDDLYPGITDFYIRLLHYLKDQKVVSFRGFDIANIMNSSVFSNNRK